MIVVNFKNYKRGLKLISRAKLVEKYLPKSIIAVPAINIFEITAETKLKTFSEHLSPAKPGRGTGFIIAEDVKEAGAKGTILNHSEHRISESEIKKTMNRCSETNLKVVLCVKSVKEAKKYKKLKPWAMAFEDPKLVGSGKSITEYRSSSVQEFSKVLKNSKTIPLCGAGINSAEDYKAAKKLGCKGVLIASAIAKVSDKKAEKFLKELST